MKRSDLTTELSTEKTLVLKDAEKIVSIIINEVTQALLLGRRAEFRGFGVFSSRVRNERIGRNPKNKETHIIQSRRSIKFKTSKNFNDKINDI